MMKSFSTMNVEIDQMQSAGSGTSAESLMILTKLLKNRR
jgi:hypothetical protein